MVVMTKQGSFHWNDNIMKQIGLYIIIAHVYGPLLRRCRSKEAPLYNYPIVLWPALALKNMSRLNGFVCECVLTQVVHLTSKISVQVVGLILI